MGIPTRLRELNINENEFNSNLDAMLDSIDNDMCTAGNPRRFSRMEKKELLLSLY